MDHSSASSSGAVGFPHEHGIEMFEIDEFKAWAVTIFPRTQIRGGETSFPASDFAFGAA